MRLAQLIIIALMTLHIGCGTEIGNGDKEKNKEDRSEAQPVANSDMPGDTENKSAYNAPDGSPFGELGISTIPVAGAVTNYCNGPANDLTADLLEFSADSFTMTAKQFEVVVAYSSEYTESVSGSSDDNFSVGLPTYICESFSQMATETIEGFEGTFTKKVQTLTSPRNTTLSVTWYVDEDSGDVARIILADPFETLVIDNDAY